MQGIEIAETDHSVLVRLDKDIMSRETIERTIEQLQCLEKFADVDYVSDEEQAELESILNSLSDEDKQMVYSHTVEVRD